MKTQKDKAQQISDDYNSQLKTHFWNELVDKQIKKLQVVSQKHHFKLNEKKYRKRMDEFRELNGEQVSRGQGITQSDYLRLLISRCLIYSLELTEKEKTLRELGRPVPSWIVESLVFSYNGSSNSIKIIFYPHEPTRETIWEKHLQKEDFSTLLSPQVMKEYHIKKIFYPEAAKAFLLQQTIDSAKQVAFFWNETGVCERLFEEIKEVLKGFYEGTEGDS